MFRPTSHMAIKHICEYFCVLVSVCGNFYWDCCLPVADLNWNVWMRSWAACILTLQLFLMGFPCAQWHIFCLVGSRIRTYVKSFFLLFFSFLKSGSFLEHANQMCSNRDALEIIEQWNPRGGSFCSIRRKFITNLHSNNLSAHCSGK